MFVLKDQLIRLVLTRIAGIVESAEIHYRMFVLSAQTEEKRISICISTIRCRRSTSHGERRSEAVLRRSGCHGTSHGYPQGLNVAACPLTFRCNLDMFHPTGFPMPASCRLPTFGHHAVACRLSPTTLKSWLARRDAT